MIDLKGKCALIVGAKRVGRDVAIRLSQEGVNLAIAYRSSKKEAEALCSKVSAVGRRSRAFGETKSASVKRACTIKGDIAVEEDVKRIVDETSQKLGGLSFVVNLASEFIWTPYKSLDGAVWDSAMAEARGCYLLGVYASRMMINNPGPTRGHMIFFGDSAAGENPYKNYLPYLTAKAAIGFMTRAFAGELAKHNILVNAICPGPTMRPPDITEEVWERGVIGKTPLRRESSTRDIAEMVVTLLKSETITGECIRVDSGVHLGAR